MFRPSALLAVAFLTVAALPARAADTPATAEETPEKVDTTLKAEDPATTPTTATTPEATPGGVGAVVTPPVEEPKLVQPNAPVKVVDPAAEGEARKAKILYVVQHVLMGGGVAFVAVEAVAVAATGVVLFAMPRQGTSDDPPIMEKMVPYEWRRAVSTGILVGVLPGLLMLAVCGGVATAVSAARNVSSFTGNN